MVTAARSESARASGVPKAGPLGTGARRGAVATVAMSTVMIAATATGVSPMPEPVPAALVSHTLGDVPQPGVIALAVTAHLAYGAVAAAVLTGLVRRVGVWTGAAYGVMLWALMGLVWLPYLGWACSARPSPGRSR